MAKKNWKPNKEQSEYLKIWRNWFEKKPDDICHPQLKARIAALPTEFKIDLFREFGRKFRNEGFTDEDVIDCVADILKSDEVWPYKGRDEKFLAELKKRLRERSQIIEHESEAVSIEDTNLAENIEIEREYKGERIGRYKGTIQTPSEIEKTIIDKIEPDIEKMKKEGLSTREIAERLKGKKGTSKSSIHRKTKPKK